MLLSRYRTGDSNEKKWVTDPTNLGNRVEFTIREPEELLLEPTGPHSRLLEQAPSADDSKLRKPYIILAQKIPGCTPQAQLADGLIRIVEHFDALYRLVQATVFKVCRGQIDIHFQSN